MILLPGIVMPAELAYGPLLDCLGRGQDAVAKTLELYAGEEPPPEYGVETEVAGVLRAADRAGFERFHLVGYSGGGAVSLAFAAAHPERLWSLALVEPAWDGNWDLSPEEQALWRELEELADGSDEEMMSGFMRLQLAPGVPPPPPAAGPAPPWMASRPAGIRALLSAFAVGSIDQQALRAFEPPVYFARGSLSNPVDWERLGERLARTFLRFREEVYEGRHHFDPPHRAEPERFAAALRAQWRSAEA